ncbi:MAG: hypothetical protein GY774_36315 [Planctomycetes bacterium]|nr:hypothetical protein [Planctomycetota bacterium]
MAHSAGEKMKPTTMRIDEVRREMLKDAAFKISMEKGEIVTMADIVKYLIDNYTNNAIKEMPRE